MAASRGYAVMIAALCVALGQSSVQARVLAQASGQVCVLPATVQPSSKVLVGGTITQPIQAKVSAVANTVFSGSFAVVFPGACPTAATLPAALNKAYIASPKSAPGITLGDGKAIVTIGDGASATPIANLAVLGVKGTVLSKPGLAGMSAPRLSATAGTVTISNSAIPISPLSLAGQALPMGGTGCTTSAKAGVVTFTCPKLSVTNPLKLDIGSGTITVTGTLVSSGKLSDAKLVPASSVPAPLA